MKASSMNSKEKAYSGLPNNCLLIKSWEVGDPVWLSSSGQHGKIEELLRVDIGGHGSFLAQ
jgi:hypothetical protein